MFWDGTGVVLVAKRLEDGEFRWPKVQDAVLHLTAAQLSRTWKASTGAAPMPCRRRACLLCQVDVGAPKPVAADMGR